jgi:hypothetical protein
MKYIVKKIRFARNRNLSEVFLFAREPALAHGFVVRLFQRIVFVRQGTRWFPSADSALIIYCRILNTPLNREREILRRYLKLSPTQ